MIFLVESLFKFLIILKDFGIISKKNDGGNPKRTLGELPEEIRERLFVKSIHGAYSD